MVSSEVKGKVSHTELIAVRAEKGKKGAWNRGRSEDRKSYIGTKVGRELNVSGEGDWNCKEAVRKR